MVGRDTVTFRFRLDAKEMQRLIKALEQDAKRFGATMSQVKGQSDQFSTGIKNSGNNAAAAAVNFQTATQGMLNLSTAAVQTFTSISNLDRAANRLAQSKIAVARAEDLLAAKQLRLNELQEKGLGHTSKAANLTNELATARADLAVKNDKARIEEGALLDIQLLFVTNVANVMISSIQTIKTLRDLQALSTIKAVAAEKLMNLSFMKSIVLSKAAAGSYKGMTFAIKGLTFSVRGLMLALGPIALLITGVTVAMQAYEENWGGFKDAVQTALPFLKESNEDLDESARILEEDRKQMEGYTSAIDSMGKSMKKLSAPHKLYLEMHRDAFLAMDKNSKLAAYYSSQLAGLRTGSQGFSTPSVGGGLPSGGGVYAGGGAVGGGVSTTGVISTAPTTGGVGTPTTVTGSSQLLSLADPHGTNEQRFVFTMLPKEEKMSVLLTKAQLSMNDGLYGAANILFEEYEKVKAKPVMETDPVKRWENMQKGVNLKETTFFGGRPEKMPDPLVTDKMQEFRFGIDIATREGIDADSTRGIVLNKTGRDIGRIADHIDVNEGIRLANLETTMSQFRNTTGGKADLAIAALGGNATAAYQVPRGSIKRHQSHIDEMKERDRLANLRRFGGYSSRQAMSKAAKEQFHKDVDEANKIAAFFGQGIDASRIRGRSSRLHEYSKVLKVGTSIREALTLAGLGYKTIETHLGSRPERWRIFQMKQDLQQTISFNHNQLAKAETINILQQDFGLTGFTGTTMSLPSLQDILAAEDERMKSIGLDRTEAFQIVDTAGRGREEIDDRLKWKSRLSSVSTGTAVL
jgi:hypothetical protein